jgi:hypothetical protein
MIAEAAMPSASAARGNDALLAAARLPQAGRRGANRRLGMVLAIIAAAMLIGTFVIAIGLPVLLNFGFGS